MLHKVILLWYAGCFNLCVAEVLVLIYVIASGALRVHTVWHFIFFLTDNGWSSLQSRSVSDEFFVFVIWNKFKFICTNVRGGEDRRPPWSLYVWGRSTIPGLKLIIGKKGLKFITCWILGELNLLFCMLF